MAALNGSGKTGSAAMTATVPGTIVTAGAGAVTIGGGWSVSTERAGAVTATGVLTVNTAGAGSVTATGVVGLVSTAGAGSVTATGGGDRVLSTTTAGFVTATGVTCSEVLNSTTGDTGVNITTSMSSAKGSGEDYAKVPWKVAAVDLPADCPATTGRTILYALVAMAVLLISVAVQCSNSMLNK